MIKLRTFDNKFSPLRILAKTRNIITLAIIFSRQNKAGSRVRTT